MGKTLLKKNIITVSVFALLFGLSSAAFANKEVDQINKKIKEKGAKWKAGITSVSKLSKEEKAQLCGLLAAERPGVKSTAGDPATTGMTETTTFPPTYDWRSQDVVTPVRDQGSCGSCWAFAAVGAMESAMLISGNSAGNNLSEQFVVSCDRTDYGCCGGFMDRVYNYLKNTGTTDESCFSYNASGYCVGNHSVTSSCKKGKCKDWAVRLETISNWQWVEELAEVPSVTSIKTALQTGPVPCGFDVYDDFYNYTDGIYEHVYGNLVGGHAVIIVGWEDENSCWIVKNSWNTGWGENGYFRIKWGNCRIGRDAGILQYSSVSCPDNDGDMYNDAVCGGEDCDDDNAAINPDAEEKCDGKDNNCNDLIDEVCPCRDMDGDGYTAEACEGQGPDCNDNNDAINPGAEEVCDGVDNNCDGTVDEGCPDCTSSGDPCNSDSDCCSGKCTSRGKSGKKKCE